MNKKTTVELRSRSRVYKRRLQVFVIQDINSLQRVTNERIVIIAGLTYEHVGIQIATLNLRYPQELFLRLPIVMQQTHTRLANSSASIHVVGHLQVNRPDVLLCLTILAWTLISFPIKQRFVYLQMCTEIGFIMNLMSPSKYLNEKRTLIKEKEDCFVIILLHFCKD